MWPNEASGRKGQDEQVSGAAVPSGLLMNLVFGCFHLGAKKKYIQTDIISVLYGHCSPFYQFLRNYAI